MKKTIILFTGIAIAITVNFSCGEQQEKQHDHATHSGQQAAAVYECPMKCENKTHSEPGNCSVCGMELIKVENTDK